MEPAFDKAFISFRIGTRHWIPDAQFHALMDLFEEFKGVTDEITFFTSETHPPLPLDVIQQRCGVLAQRMSLVRELGYRSGINVLATLGHHNENLPNSLGADYVRMTDLDGSVCQGSFCPNDDRMRGYITRVYDLTAAAEPDYIWIDDDVRLMGHMPIGCGCFCDRCLELFEKECGVKYTRELLAKTFNGEPRDAKLKVRRAWLQHNRDTLARLFKLIEETVHKRKPGMPLGFMTGDRFFEGYDFDRWAEVLSGAAHREVMWRPGGGNYTDEWLDGTTQKAHQMGRQTALLPPTVRSIQSEIESFPYQRLKKSAHSTALEAASYIAGGCTGAAFNVLSMYTEPLDEYELLVAKLKETRPFLDLLARNLGRANPIGVHTGWCKDSFAAKNANGGNWFSAPDPGTDHANELFATGIPAAYAAEQARVTALSGDSVLAFKDDELKRMLSGGVYMDAPALALLNEMGYAELTGFAVERVMDHDCIEELLEHPLNAGFAARRRDGRQSFWKCPAYALGHAAKAEALARIIDYADKETARCCMGVFENSLGGRVCVAGYCPWTHLQSLSKASQLKAVFRWLSKDTLPAYVVSYHRANLWVREPDAGTLAIAVINARLDAAEGLTLAVRTDRDTAKVYDMACAEASVKAQAAAGPYRLFSLPTVAPWEMRLVVV